MSPATLRQINSAQGKTLHHKQGIIVLGRVAPFGIGAVIGGGANATLAAWRAFGPAPAVVARDRAGARASDAGFSAR